MGHGRACTRGRPAYTRPSVLGKLSTAAALKYLHDRGAHFVLTKGTNAPEGVDPKSPVWRAWNRRKPSIAVILHHIEARGGDVALIPASLRTTALDVDYGPIEDVIEGAGEPFALLPSKRREDGHAYYHDPKRRRNVKFRFGRASGEIRSTAYAVMYPRGAQLLTDAIASGRRTLRGLTPDLFASAGVPMPRQPVSGRPGTVLPLDRKARSWQLEDVEIGQRHFALFDTVRFQFYHHRRDRNLPDWIGRVEQFAHSQNARFEVPQPDSEIKVQAYSIATWIWDGGGPLDHSPETQSRRGRKSGRVRRGEVAGLTSYRPGKAAEDAEIVQAYVKGETMRSIAARHGLALSTISYVVNRDAELLKEKGEPLSRARPWEREGVSRATWYRRRQSKTGRTP